MKKTTIILLVLFLLAGCGYLISATNNTGSLSFSIAWAKEKQTLAIKVIPAKTHKIDIIIKETGLDDINKSLIYPENKLVVNQITPGKKIILAKAFDENNNELANGQTEAMVEGWKKTSVVLELTENKIVINEPSPNPEKTPEINQTKSPDPISISPLPASSNPASSVSGSSSPTITLSATPKQPTPSPIPSPSISPSSIKLESITLSPEKLILYQNKSKELQIILKDSEGNIVNKNIDYELSREGIIKIKNLEDNVLEITGLEVGEVILKVKADNNYNYIIKYATIQVVPNP